MDRKTPKQRVEMMISATKRMIKSEDEKSKKVTLDYQDQIHDFEYILQLINSDESHKEMIVNDK
jgi:Cu/Ag efflux protein CusF